MKRILVTGFSPFGGDLINPALEAVKALNGRTICGNQLITCEIPVVRHDAINAIAGHIKHTDPFIVLAVGQAGGRMEINPERVAINIDDFRIKDNGGFQPVDEPIIPGAPAAYWSTLPIKAMVAAMRAGGIPASVSNTAGTFVCNHLFYGLMHLLAQEGNTRRGGFVHIPYLPEQAARNPIQPSMSLEIIVRGLELALEAAVKTLDDIKETGGKIC